MSYRDFTIDEVKPRFSLRLEEHRGPHASIPPVEISPLLRETLAENVPLTLAISTEKPRPEFIIAPVLLEARRQASLFSGIEFTIDPERGLDGVCDVLPSRSPEPSHPSTTSPAGRGRGRVGNCPAPRRARKPSTPAASCGAAT